MDAERLRLVATQARSVASRLDLHAVLREVTAATVTLRPRASCTVRLVDQGAGGYRLGASAGVAAEASRPLVAFGEGLTHAVAQRREPLLVEQAPEDVRALAGPWLRAPDLGVYYGVPIEAGGEVLGVMNVVFPAGETVTAEEREAIRLLADLAAAAIRNARLLEAEREARDRYRAIVEGSIQGILVHRDGGILFANREAARLFGVTRPEDMVGRIAMDFVAPEDRERMEGYRAARPRGEPAPSRYEVRLLDPAGHRAWVDCAVSVVEWEGAPATLVTMVDITERRSLETQLQQAQKMEAIGRLAGSIAHDFNNLLTVITGREQLLVARLALDENARRDFEIMEEATARAVALVQQLLAFARRQPRQPEVLHLDELVDGLAPMVRLLAGEDIAVRVDVAPPLGRVFADRGQMEQVVLNLALNARDAMPSGGTLTIEITNVELDAEYARRHVGVTPGAYVMLAVGDTGVGMDQETMARVFEPFFTTKAEGQGTGLGLSIVYGIVQQSGGHIWLQSEPGVGTTFMVYLPRVEEAAARRGEGAAGGDDLDGSETILLVEDDDQVRDLVQEVLEIHGYDVLQAASGPEALRRVGEHEAPIHLLLTDVVMPGMNGREVAQRVRALRPEVRTAYISGYTDDTIVRHGGIDPGAVFIQKPFLPHILARKVREALDPN